MNFQQILTMFKFFLNPQLIFNLIEFLCIFLVTKAILRYMLRIPLSTKNIKKVTEMGNKESAFDNIVMLFTGWITDKILNKLGKFIKINEYDKQELERKLERAGLKMTIEELYAKRLMYLVGCIFSGFAFYLVINNPLFIAAGVILGIIGFNVPVNDLDKEIIIKNTKMIKELGRFVRTLWRSPRSKPMVSVIGDYKKIAKGGLKSEVTQLYADMIMGDETKAWRKFAQRINHPIVRQIVQVILNIYDVSGKKKESEDEMVHQKIDEKINDMFERLDDKVRSAVMNAVKIELDRRPEKLELINDLMLVLIGALNAIPSIIQIYQDYYLQFK